MPVGSKDQAPFDNPAGLIERSKFDNQEGVIVVSINYRLGMFGFLYNEETNIGEAAKITGANPTTVDDLRQLNSSNLIQISQAAVFESAYSLFTYGPLADGDFVSDLPGVLLLNGQFYAKTIVTLRLCSPPSVTDESVKLWLTTIKMSRACSSPQ
jgi:hypothetical protein